MVTFNPTVTPSYGTGKESKVRKELNNFGDGYTQRVSIGANPKYEIWNLTWKILSDTEAQEIVDFFEAREEVESFDWTTPEGVLKKFVGYDCVRTFDDFGSNSVTVRLEQVYDN
jgi:phage-related protein